MKKVVQGKIEEKYRCILFVPLHLNDAISAIDIIDDNILYGTIMGNVKLIQLNPRAHHHNNTNNTMNNSLSVMGLPQVNCLVELATENISCCSFESREVFNVGIGDMEILQINISNGINNPIFSKIKNYPNENEHIKYCESCTCFITDSNFIKINTEFCENNEPIEKRVFDFENRKLQNFEIIAGDIETTNFSVPFDFDGDKFLWVDFISPKKRRICVAYTLSNRHQIFIPINEDFGHISHMKLLPGNKIFLVRKLNLCEIRTLSNSFELVEKFYHIGKEVISSFVYIEGTKITEEDYGSSSYGGSNENSINNKNDFPLKVKVNKNEVQSAVLIIKDNESCNPSQSLRSNNNSNNSMKFLPRLYESKSDTYIIGTLDFDGNFNIYQNKKETTLFNLYDIENIPNDFKKKELFSIGFPYYITFNKFYYVFGCDHGIIIIPSKRIIV